MEKTRKQLKISSIVVLIFAAVSLLNVVSELLFGDLKNAVVPEGSPENIVPITQIILFGISIILLIPRVYIGIKGLLIAKSPNPTKGHIVWGIILLVLAILDLISPIYGIIVSGVVGAGISNILGVLLEIIVYYEYVKYAIAVSKAG